MKPSQTFNVFWLFSANKAINSQITKNSFPNAGKWLLFVDQDKIDGVWGLIETATQKGELGIGSKCSTMRDNPHACNKKQMVICVYTKDYHDKKDVFRVREKLRKMGFVGKLPYKTNQATRQGKYSGEGKRVSLYYE